MDTELEHIRAALVARRGELRRLSAASSVGYDTVLRVRDDTEYEPGFRKIERLARALGMRVAIIK